MKCHAAFMRCSIKKY
ncbi:hypothetical protein Zm00014a_021896 [Zea mays]|uniref:Uncharacterized protein n=1 Tax=Zea mays TaxID=4577 RepID=A0A3L6GAH0_MAIZE|nr:hypothetical protein Zm00014a_021896 [Zea mays]